MREVTLTEAMNIQGVLVKRMQDDIAFISTHCVRESRVIDPLDEEGGAKKLLSERIQSFYDKRDRFLAIRKAVNEKNAKVTVTIEATEEEDGASFKEEKCIKDWLDWDRNARRLEEALWGSVKAAQDHSIQEMSGFGRQTASKDEVEKKLVFPIPLTRAPKELAAILTRHSKLDACKSVTNATKTVEIP